MLTQDTIFTHIGCSKFDESKFIELGKDFTFFDFPLFLKPKGGLWGSIKDSQFSFIDFFPKESFHGLKKCNGYENYNENLSFDFKVKNPCKILEIKNESDYLKNFEKQYVKSYEPKIIVIEPYYLDYVPSINWDKITKDFDGIYVCAGSNKNIGKVFFRWDCDTILIFHKEAIILL